MTVNMTGALGAYKQVVENTTAPGMAPRDEGPGKGFGDILSSAMSSVAQTGAAAETATVQALGGRADLNDVAMAVANADIALQTVVAVRDKVISAYQDILRMPM
jgi:flagellar hook-basal body complex protein FliE